MFIKRLTLVFVFVFLLFSEGFSQNSIMLTKLQSSETPVRLKTLKAKVRVYGYLSETSVWMEFFNPNSRTLEGELSFPLPEGAMLAGYALDVGGDLIDGVAVEKQKAREVFETEVRRGVDPGLIEKVKGNNFKTRVYPLSPRQSRKVKVVFTQDLSESDGEAVYRFPMQFSEKIDEFSLRLEVVGEGKKPVATIEGFAGIDFRKGVSGWFSEIKEANLKLASEVVLKVPQDNSDQVFVEKADDDKFYFCIQGSRPVKKGLDAISAKKVLLLFDASNSGSSRDISAEKDFLRSLFKIGVLNNNSSVELLSFRNKPEKGRLFDLRGGLDGLLAEIDRQVFDGASCFSNLNEVVGQDVDLVILLSDGINTFGKNRVPEFACPVIAISSCFGSDFGFLRALANRSGGKLINLKKMNSAEAARYAAASFWGIVEKNTDKSAAELVPTGAQAVAGRFYLAGVLEGNSAEVALKFGSSGQIEDEKKYLIKKDAALKGDFLRKFWAGKKIAELLAAKDENRSEIIKLSSKHGIVTEFTSLMVLERVEQYVEHHIVPPSSKPDWRRAYFEAVEAEEAQIAGERQKNIEKILAMWNSRLEWWKTDFSKVDLKQLGKAAKLSLDSVAPRGAAMEADSFADRSVPQSAMFDDAMEESKSIAAAPNEIAGGSFDKEMAESKKDFEEEKARPVNPGVAIKAWKPDAEYAKLIDKAKDPFAEYLKQKKEYGNAPSFYLDCADLFNEPGKAELAVQILSNLAELELENPALLRILAHRLAQLEELGASADIFAEVLEMRKEEPQSYRDLALVLARIGRYEEAIALIYEVVVKTWDSRFPEIEVIALEEMNNMIVKARAAGVEKFNVDERLIKPIDVDLRIVMTWDADMTDMDLWVMEPSGEKAFYSNPRTAIGGLVSRDFTRGYGPEEYMIRRAKTGTYEIKTNFYGSSSQKIAGAVTLQVDIFTNYGRSDEKRRSVTLRLKENKDTFTVAEIEF